MIIGQSNHFPVAIVESTSRQGKYWTFFPEEFPGLCMTTLSAFILTTLVEAFAFSFSNEKVEDCKFLQSSNLCDMTGFQGNYVCNQCCI